MERRGGGRHLVRSRLLQRHIRKNDGEASVSPPRARTTRQPNQSKQQQYKKMSSHPSALAIFKRIATLALGSQSLQFISMVQIPNHLRLLIHGKDSPARNMAIDEALLRLVTTPVLRIYGWNQPCYSLGYFQKSTVVPDGQAFVRRYTGGGLVEHGKDLTYTLVLPADHPLTLEGTIPSYRKIHQAVAEALTECGISCQLATARPENDDPSCFSKPVPADVLDAQGLKLAGAAQRRTKEGCLHQGSILLTAKIPADLPTQLTKKIALGLQSQTQLSNLSTKEVETADQLESSRYSSRAWSFSR